MKSYQPSDLKVIHVYQDISFFWYKIGTNSDERIQRKLEPTVIFNLGGNDSQRNVEEVVFEADYNALYDLYQNLECIQEKLDELKA